VREKRKGPMSIAGGLVDSVAATVRRMQRDREPRALVYDPTGYARLIQPEARGHARILEIAEAMVAQAGSDGAGRSTKESADEDRTREPKASGAGAKSGRAKPAKPRASRQSKASSGKAGKAAAKPAKRSAGGTRARQTKGKAAADSPKPRRQRTRRGGPEKA
jgi:hypothetical protein